MAVLTGDAIDELSNENQSPEHDFLLAGNIDETGETQKMRILNLGIDNVQVIYVSQNGDDTGSHKTRKTISQAVTDANALTPSSTNRIAIVVLDDATYTEDVTLANFVSLFMPYAEFDGRILTQGQNVVKVDRHTTNATNGVGYDINDAQQTRYECRILTVNSGHVGVQLSASAELHAYTDLMTVTTATGVKKSSGTADVYLHLNRLELDGSDTFGIDHTGLQVHAKIGKITDIGATNGNAIYDSGTSLKSQFDIEHIETDTGIETATTGQLQINIRLINCTTCINHTGTGIVNVMCNNMRGTTDTYNVTNASGTLNMFVCYLVGTPGTVTGTANVTTP